MKIKQKIDLKFWISIAGLSLLGLFFMFCLRGYSFSALVCFALAALVTAYKLLKILGNKKDKLAKALTRALNVCVCIGLAVVLVTGIIIGASCFGSSAEAGPYLIVLGAGVRGSTPSASLQDRIDSAYSYLTEHPHVICILSGGQGPDEDISEAQCMYNALTAMGIDGSRLWLEDKSTSTGENLEFSLNLIENRTGARPDKIHLMSSEYHLFRAGLFAEEQGVEALGVPARTSNPARFVNYFLREIAGVWHYILLGGRP